MATISSMQLNSEQATVYREPTYHLYLTPQEAPKACHFKTVGQKSPPYQSLDRLVDVAMQKRYGDELRGLPTGKVQKLRRRMAHNFMERPDQKFSMKIQLPLAEAQGLVKRAKDRLQKVASDDPKKVDLTPLAEFVFSDTKEESFGLILGAKLVTLFGSTPASEQLRNALFKEVCQIRKELDGLTSGETKYFRPPQETDGSTYIDYQNKTVTLAQTIPSSYDRMNPDVQNGRMNLDSKGRVIYSTGRIENTDKATQALYHLIHQTFVSGQIDEGSLIQQSDGSLLYPVVIENLISSAPFISREKKLLLQEDNVLKSLSGSNMTITLPSGKQLVVKLKLMHFSTQINFNAFLGQGHGWSSTGSDVAEQITNEGTATLNAYYQEIKGSLRDNTQRAVEHCLKELSVCTNLRDRLIYRAFLCEFLNISYHVHCKSSKDRTAIVAAIKKALHLWLQVEDWKTAGGIKIPDPKEFFNNNIFREYSEAAFFENLPLTDQGVGISGVLDGKLYTQDRGFNYQKSILEHPFPAYVLSDRYLHKSSLLERVLYTGMMAATSLVLITLYVALTPIILVGMAYKYRKDFWEAYKYVFLTIAMLPTLSAARPQWINRDSPELEERRFFLKHNII